MHVEALTKKQACDQEERRSAKTTRFNRLLLGHATSAFPLLPLFILSTI